MHIFCFHAPTSLGVHSGQFSLHFSHQGNRGFSLSMEIGESGGAIYLWLLDSVEHLVIFRSSELKFASLPFKGISRN